MSIGKLLHDYDPMHEHRQDFAYLLKGIMRGIDDRVRDELADDIETTISICCEEMMAIAVVESSDRTADHINWVSELDNDDLAKHIALYPEEERYVSHDIDDIVYEIVRAINL